VVLPKINLMEGFNGICGGWPEVGEVVVIICFFVAMGASGGTATLLWAGGILFVSHAFLDRHFLKATVMVSPNSKHIQLYSASLAHCHD